MKRSNKIKTTFIENTDFICLKVSGKTKTINGEKGVSKNQESKDKALLKDK